MHNNSVDKTLPPSTTRQLTQQMPKVTRRRSFVDRYLFSTHPPSYPYHSSVIPNELVPYVNTAKNIQDLLDHAFPPENAAPAQHSTQLTVALFNRAVHALDTPITLLISPIAIPPAESPALDYPYCAIEANIPSVFVLSLSRTLLFRTLATNPQSLPFKPVPQPWLPYLPILRQKPAKAAIDALLITILRAMNALTNFSDLFTTTFAADSRLLPLLFEAMRCEQAVELAFALVEDILHAPSHRPDLDLSTVKHLPSLIDSFRPLQLGSFCRILAPLVDERDLPRCGGDHCSGACKSSSHPPTPDWQQIEPAKSRLRARRSYLGAASRAIRDRNHAVVLSIPGLIEKLVKLISVPPAPRDELALVDHIPRGVLYGTETWKALDTRIRRAVRDHANGVRDSAGVFRERRRLGGAECLGVGLRVVPGETHGVLEITALVDLQPAPNVGTNTGNAAQNTASGTTTSHVNIVRHGGGSLASSPTTGTGDGGQRFDREEEMQACPYMFFNRLLMSAHQVEVLFVLHSLLVGRRKRELQALLVDMGIFPILNRFCDALNWSRSTRETKTEESLKMHFIRLLHYMWDGVECLTPDDRLEVLFSDHERRLLEAIEDGQIAKFELAGSQAMSLKSVSPHEPLLLGVRNLSLSPCGYAKRDGTVEAVPAPTVHSPTTQSTSADGFEADFSLDNVSSHAVGTRDDEEVAIPVDSRITDNGLGRDASVKRESGIVCKVAKILMKTPVGDESQSILRFLLSGCLETYLRGATVHEKTVVAHEGLLIHLLKQLSESDHLMPQVNQFRQTSFDLLGQLVKWNRRLFNFMNEVFRQHPRLLPDLLRTVSDRLIDSNVFMRSLAISLEYFRGEDEIARVHGKSRGSPEPYDFARCLLWEVLEKNRARLIQDLLQSVRVDDVNFENICCVNTTLILLATSCSTEETLDVTLFEILENVLASLKMHDAGPQDLFTLHPAEIFANFERLISFWLSYYQHQSLDVASLELSSNIQFDRLVALANLLKSRLPLLNSRAKEGEFNLARQH